MLNNNEVCFNPENPYTVTHDGVFHTDEVLAIVILSSVTSCCQIVRTRHPETIKNAEYAVDVGGVYNPSKGQFDHHQKDKNLPRYEDLTPYSSLGMVWSHYGRDFLNKMNGSSETDDDLFKRLYDKVTEQVIKPIDAWDNGVKDAPRPSIVPIISGFNMNWWEKETENKYENGQFFKALKIGTDYLLNEIHHIFGSILSESVMQKADRSIKGLVLLDNYCAWQAYTKEEDMIVIFPYKSGRWMAQCVTVSKDSRELKVRFFKEWSGLPTEELKEMVNEGCNFVHHTGFIAGFETKESAIDASKQVLKIANM